MKRKKTQKQPLKRLKQRCFPVKFAKYLGTPILKNIRERLLLKTANIMSIILFKTMWKGCFFLRPETLLELTSTTYFSRILETL